MMDVGYTQSQMGKFSLRPIAKFPRVSIIKLDAQNLRLVDIFTVKENSRNKVKSH